MSHSVIKVSLSAIDQMKMTYSGSLTASVPQGAVFQANRPAVPLQHINQVRSCFKEKRCGRIRALGNSRASGKEENGQKAG